MFLYNEIVKCGNNTARVKNFYANNLIILMDINGTFNVGDTIVGVDSGHTYTFKNSFTISYDYDAYYDPTFWDELNLVTQDDGSAIGIDEYESDTTESRDENSKYLVVLE